MDVDKDVSGAQQDRPQGNLGAPIIQSKSRSSAQVSFIMIALINGLPELSKVPQTNGKAREVEEEVEMVVDNNDEGHAEGHVDGVRLGSATTKQYRKGKKAASQG